MEGVDFDSIDWDAEVVPELVPLAQSAPPQASPEYEEVPEFPPRLSHRHVRSTGRVRGKGFFLTYSQSALARDTIIGWFSRQNALSNDLSLDRSIIKMGTCIGM